MANIVTSSRILFGIALLFFPAFSPTFYVFYGLAGFTDMIDGTIARMTNTVSEFGAKLDTIADFIFIAVCLIKLLPCLRISTFLWIWIGVITVIKVMNIVYGYKVQKKFVSEHTIMNKLTGAALFVLPLTLSIIDLNCSGSFACAIATIAAVQEGHLIRGK